METCTDCGRLTNDFYRRNPLTGKECQEVRCRDCWERACSKVSILEPHLKGEDLLTHAARLRWFG